MKKQVTPSPLWVALICLISIFCFNSASFAEAVSQGDPLEGFNRAMFTFNDNLDKAILKPVATFYNTIMPKPLNKGVHNFFNNINNLPIIADDILQADFKQATSDVWRLVINTTVGIGGLFDVADRLNLKQNTNDFGLTLARWGYKNSTYVVWPFFGPSTIRDGIGLPVDYYVFSIYPYINPQSTRLEVYGLSVVDRRAQLLQYQSVMEEAALDRYVFMRNAYLQNRAYLMQKNSSSSESSTMQPLDAAETAENATSDTTMNPSNANAPDMETTGTSKKTAAKPA